MNTKNSLDVIPFLLGAHTSIAKGFENAIYEGASIGATTVQIFTANQRQWSCKELNQNSINAFKKALDETGLSSIMSHDSFLINLGAPNNIILEKSRQAFRQEISRCLQLGICYLNFHPGAALISPRDTCLATIAESLTLMEDLFSSSHSAQSLCLLLEMTAGQGSTVGKTLEEIQIIIDKVQGRVPLGVCVDTCHIFAAGYDIRTQEGVNTFLKNFDEIIGLSYLKAFHINDSKKECGSRVDRHESLGKGHIGCEAFTTLMKNPKTQMIPKYLETPEGPNVWKKEIEWLRSQATGYNAS